MDFSATELQRIYQLKSEGVQAVLADIQAIDDAFRQSAKARADLAGGTTGYDASQMAQVNKQLEAMLEIQTDMLSVMKGLNVEFAKTAPAIKEAGVGAAKAADSMEELSAGAKDLGTNLTGAVVNLTKVQTVLNGSAGTMGQYYSSILELTKKYESLAITLNKVEDEMSDLEVAKVAEAEANDVIEEKETALIARREIILTQMRELDSVARNLTRTYNSATADMTLPPTTAQIRQRGNQEIRGEALAKQYDPEYIANRKQAQQLERTEVELLKNQSIAANEAASYYQRLAANVNILKIQMRLLTEEEVKNEAVIGPMRTKLQALNAEIVAFEKSMGNAQRLVGQYERGKSSGFEIGGVRNIGTMFTRQLIRGIGGAIIFGLIFDGIRKITEAMAAALPGTDAYIEKQKQLAQALDQVKTEFQSVLEHSRQFDADIENALLSGQAIYQNQVDIATAKGAVSGQQYKADKEQFDATQKLRDKELADLDKYNEKLNQVNLIYRAVDKYRDLNVIRQSIKDLGLSAEDYKKYNTILEDFLKTRRSNPKARLFNNDAIVQAQSKASAEAEKKQAQKENEATAFEARHNQLVYAKNVELNEQLRQLDIQYRELREKEDLATVDKIVEATTRKYQVMIDRNQKAAVDYMKSISAIVPDKGAYDAGGVLTDEYYKQEYQAIKNDTRVKKYAASEEDYVRNRKQDIANQELVNRRRAELSNSNFQSQAATANSGFTTFNANYGLPDYQAMAKAQDKALAAQKLAAENIAEQKKAQALQESQSTAFANDKIGAEVFLYTREKEIEDEKNKTIIQLDKQAYAERLQLGMQYFEKITAITDQHSRRLIQDIDTYNLERIAKVLNSHRSSGAKDRITTKIENQNITAQANETIRNSQIDLNTLDPQFKAALDAADKAKASGDVDKYAEANKQLNVVLDRQSKLEHDIAEAKVRKAKATNDIDWGKLIGDQMIQTAQTVSSAYMDLLAKQDAYREEMAQRSLEWNQQVQKAEVQSANQQLAENRANLLAQRQLSKEKMQDDKKRAETQLIISYVIGLAKDWELGWPAGVVAAAGQTVELGVGEAALAKAPAYAGGTGDTKHPGGLAWLGDGGEHELIVSPKSPTLMNLPAGSSVVPFSKLPVPGDLGASLKAPSFSAPSYSNGGAQDSGNMHAAIAQAVHAALSNVQVNVNYDPRKAQKSAMAISYSTRKL